MTRPRLPRLPPAVARPFTAALSTAALALALAGAPAPAAAQHITHSSPCHPLGSATYSVGESITFEYHPPAPPVLPKPPILDLPPCVDLTLTAEDVTGKPPLTFTWTSDHGHRWTGNPLRFDTGVLPSGLTNLVLVVANPWGEAIEGVNLHVQRLVPPIPAPVPDDAPSPDLEVAFTASAFGARDWRWDFGDGTSSAWQTPCGFTTSAITHTFPSPGTYTVTAYARNCRDGTVASQPLEVAVGDPNTIDLLHFQAIGCTDPFCVFPRDQPIGFEIETTAPPDAYYYDWDGDHTIDQVTLQPTTHAYPAYGVYTPTLTVTRGTATATLVHPTLILIN